MQLLRGTAIDVGGLVVTRQIRASQNDDGARAVNQLKLCVHFRFETVNRLRRDAGQSNHVHYELEFHN